MCYHADELDRLGLTLCFDNLLHFLLASLLHSEGSTLGILLRHLLHHTTPPNQSKHCMSQSMN